MRTAIGRMAWAAGAALFAGCTTSIQGCPVKYREEAALLEVPATSARSLVVEGRAGSIDAGPGADGAKVTVHALKRAKTREDLLRIRVRAVSDGEEVRVGYEVEGDDDGISVSFTVEAPASLRARLRTGAGSIRVSGFEGGAEVHSGAGSVESAGVRGDQSLESGAGSVRVEGADGCVRAKSSAGSIRAAGRLRGDCSLVTQAGSVEVHLPADARLKVVGRTAAGSVRTEFPLAVDGEYAGKSLGGTLGDGSEGTLRLESSAGSITIRKQ